MSKRVDRLAGQLATRMLREAGVAKSEASAAAVMPYAVGLAESVVMVEKALKRAVREVGRHRDAIGRLVDANGERISALADRYAASMVPGVTEIHRGVVDMDLQRFRVGLVDQEAAPKTMNGHQAQEDGPAAPLWRPESDGGM